MRKRKGPAKRRARTGPAGSVQVRRVHECGTCGAAFTLERHPTGAPPPPQPPLACPVCRTPLPAAG